MPAPLLTMRLQTRYGLLQWGVMLLLLLRTLSLASFQPRLALIPSTLAAAAPGLAYLVLAVMLAFLMAAVALVRGGGERGRSTATLVRFCWWPFAMPCHAADHWCDVPMLLSAGALCGTSLQGSLHSS